MLSHDRFQRMAQHSHREDDQKGYTVRSPRVTDGVGQALLATFRVSCLPADMQEALRTLERARPA